MAHCMLRLVICMDSQSEVAIKERGAAEGEECCDTWKTRLLLLLLKARRGVHCSMYKRETGRQERSRGQVCFAVSGVDSWHPCGGAHPPTHPPSSSCERAKAWCPYGGSHLSRGLSSSCTGVRTVLGEQGGAVRLSLFFWPLLASSGLPSMGRTLLWRCKPGLLPDPDRPASSCATRTATRVLACHHREGCPCNCELTHEQHGQALVWLGHVGCGPLIAPPALRNRDRCFPLAAHPTPLIRPPSCTLWDFICDGGDNLGKYEGGKAQFDRQNPYSAAVATTVGRVEWGGRNREASRRECLKGRQANAAVGGRTGGE